MKATIVNKSNQAFASGYMTVQPGQARSFTGLDLKTSAVLASKASLQVEVELSPDLADNPVWQAVMQTPADPAASVRVLAGEGFTVQTGGSAITTAEPVGLAVFDDAACTIPSVHGFIDTATDGTITSGSGTNAVFATVNTANGKLTVSVHSTIAQPIWVKPIMNPGATHFLDCSVFRKTTFS